jgi:hypothetical protein
MRYLLADVPKAVQTVQDLLVALEAEEATFFPNVGMHTSDDTALHPRKPESCKFRGSLAS